EVAPYFIEGIIPGGVYEGVDEDVEYVPALWNWLVIHADASDELVYQLTEALYENRETLEGATPVAEETLVENLEELTTPLHPGAITYAEEQGIELPDVAYGD